MPSPTETGLIVVLTLVSNLLCWALWPVINRILGP
jgi:hypothetical protein